MKKKAVKALLAGLCTVICVSGVGIGVYAGNREKEQIIDPVIMEATVEPAAVKAAVPAGVGENQGKKDETVYILAGADGSTQKIIVSDWLSNADGAQTITDQTILDGIYNTKGEETYSGNTEEGIVWNAAGNDIYYQGTSQKELPVEMKVTYTLDGAEISPAELAGKSGKVTIRFDYKNNQSRKAEVNGTVETMYVPYAVLTGTILDGEVFRNVEVINARLVNDGDRTIVVGMALPGMQDSLKIAKDKFEIPDHVEITADVTNFRMNMTVTVATNEVFNTLDELKFDSVEDLSGSMGQLKDAMDQLLDGSSKLTDGLNILLDKTGALSNGVNQLADGSTTLKDGAVSLESGAGQLCDGMSQLYSGLGNLKANNDSLNGGARQVFDTLLATANSQLAAAGLSVPTLTVDNYADVLTGVIASLDGEKVYETALGEVTAAVEANRPVIVEKVTAAVQQQVEAGVVAAVSQQVSEKVTMAVEMQVTEQVIAAATQGTMDGETYRAAVAEGMVDEATQAAISQAISDQMATAEVQGLIEANLQEQMESDEVKAIIAQNLQTQMQAPEIQQTISEHVEAQVQQAISDTMASEEVQSKLAAASQGAQTIMGLKTSLDSYNSFYRGLGAYTAGVASAYDGAGKLNAGLSTLKDGATQLKNGSVSLNDGVNQLKGNIPALIDGITQLRDGSMQLNEGLEQFYEEGIQKLIDAVDGDLEGMTERVQALIDISKSYNNYSGIADHMEGSVKFIYRTEEIHP